MLTKGKPNIKKILVISLTNIGDVIMTFPVLDILRQDFPQAQLSVVVGPKAEPLFVGNKNISRVYVFRKRQSLPALWRWLLTLRRENFDLVVDLRNTVIPFLISRRYLTAPFLARRKGQHMRQQHLSRLRSVYAFERQPRERYALSVSSETRLAANNLLCARVGDRQRYVVVAPGAADTAKRWPEACFAELCDALVRDAAVKVVLVGDRQDRPAADNICGLMQTPAVNLCGEVSLTQLAVILEKSCLAVVNDSAVMHLASYLDVPTLAIFGPTDPRRYGPWSGQCRVLEKKATCPACQGQPGAGGHSCLAAVSARDALDILTIRDGQSIFHLAPQPQGAPL